MLLTQGARLINSLPAKVAKPIEHKLRQTIPPRRLRTWREPQTNPIPNIDSHTRTIELMVHEARVVTDGLDPENNILTHTGVKIPHPEPYSGEPDLERFEVFVAGLLLWLSMNLLLGSEVGSTLAQLRYLGTCLRGDALEWYSHNVEHFL